MKRILLIFILLVACGTQCFSQQVDWIRSGGGYGLDGGKAIAVDQVGNNYTAGLARTDWYIYPKWGNDSIVRNSVSGYDAFIVKHDKHGNQKWLVSFGGEKIDLASDIRLIGDTTLIVCGVYNSDSTTFGSIKGEKPRASGGHVAFVAKYDTSGQVKWVKTMQIGKAGFSINTPAYNPSIDVNDKGDILFGGIFRDTMTIGTTKLTTSRINYEASYLMSFSNNGTLKWSKKIGQGYQVKSPFVALDNDSNAYVTGVFHDSIILPGKVLSDSGGYGDGFLLKLNSTGNYVWGKDFGTWSQDFIYGIDIDRFNHLFIIGRISDRTFKIDTITIKPHAASIPNDSYVAMFDTSGSIKWYKAFGGISGFKHHEDYCYALSVDNRGNVGLGGTVSGLKVKLGNDTTTFGVASYALHASLVDSTGDFIWSKLGRTSTFFTSSVLGIGFDTSKNVYITGIAAPPITFSDANWGTGAGFQDAFVIKFNDCSDADTAEIYSGSLKNLCVGDSLKLWSNNDPNLKYQWLGNGGELFLQTDSIYNATLTADYAVVVSDQGCIDTSQTIKVKINALPNVSLSNFPIACIGNPSFTLKQGAPLGGIYSGNGVSSDSIFNPSVAGLGSHIIKYQLTDTNKCTDSTSNTISVGGTTAYLAAQASVCLNHGSFVLTGGFPLGGRYAGAGILNDSIFYPDSAGVGIHSVMYIYESSGCLDTAIRTLEVKTTPSVTFSSIPDQCVGTFSVDLSLHGLSSGGVFFGTAVIGSNFYPSISGIGTFTVGYTISSAGCSDTAYSTILVASPTSSLANFSNKCVNDSAFHLQGGLPVGGQYFINGILDSVFTPNTFGVGTHIVKYKINNLCGIDSSTVSIQIDSIPNVSLSSFVAVCSGGPTIALSGGIPSGGNYTGAGVSGGVFSPDSAGAGSHAINYRYTDGKGCSNTATQIQVVHAQPNVTFSSLSSVCIDAGIVSLSGGSPLPGTYSGLGVSGSNFNPQTAGVGTHTITYKHTDTNSCSDSSSQILVVNSLPTVSLLKLNSVCLNTSSFILTGGTPIGGTYSGTGISGGKFNPNSAGVGSHLVTYSYSDGNNCGNTDTTTLVVNAQPNAGLSSLVAICAGAPNLVLSGGTPTGGIYSGVGVSGSNFSPGTAGAGSHTIRYIYTDGNSCSDTATQIQVVYVQPNVTFSSLSSVCIDAGIVSLSGGSPLPGAYSGLGVSGSNFNPQTAGVGTHTITYKHTDTNSCTDSSSQTLVVNSLPAVSLSNLNSVCLNTSSFNLSGGTPIGGVYSGSGILGGKFDPNSAGVGSHSITYSYTDSNNCGNSDTSTLIVNAQPNAGLSGLAAVCSGASSFLLSGGTPAGGAYSGVGVSGSNFSPRTSGAGSHTIRYIYTDGNSCSDTANQVQVVYAQPNVTLSSFGNICANSPTFTLSGGSPIGGNYKVNGSIASSISPIALGKGVKSVRYLITDTNNCTDSASQTLTIDSVPILNYSALSNICYGSNSVKINKATPIGGIYSGTGIFRDSLFNSVFAGTGVHTLKYVFKDGNNCKDSTAQSITVDSLPIINFAITLDSICNNSDSLLLLGTPSGGTYTGNGVVGSYFNPKNAVLGFNKITYSFVGTNGCSDTIFDSIRVDSVAILSFSLPDSICAKSPTISLANGLPLGGVYFGANVTGGAYTPSSIGNRYDSVFYAHSNAYGCTDTIMEVVRIDSLPLVILTPISPFCETDSISLSGGFPLGGSYSGKDVNGIIFNPTDSGKYSLSYSYMNSFGCLDSVKSTVQVFDQPNVQLASLGALCKNTPDFKLTNGTPIGGRYYGTGIINDSILSAKLFTLRSDFLGYKYTDSNSCSDSVSVSIHIDTIPKVSFDSIPFSCTNNASFKLSQGTPSNGTYSGTAVSLGFFNPSMAGWGIHRLKYQYTNGNSCTDSAFRNIQVDSVVVAQSFSPIDLCLNEEIQLPKGKPLGGLYQGYGVVRDSVFSSFGMASGIHKIQYILSSRCGNDTSINTIIINNLPVVSLDRLGPYCEQTDTVIKLEIGTPVGGKYNVSGVEQDSIDLFKMINSFYVGYELTDTNGCYNSDSTRVVIHKKPEIILEGKTTVCSNDSLKLTATSGLDYYVWNNDTGSSHLALPFFLIPYEGSNLKLMVSKNNCNADSTIEISRINCNYKFSLHPNPNAGIFGIYLHSDFEKEIDIFIYDSGGKEILKETTGIVRGFNALNVDIPWISAGFYLVKVDLKSEVHNIKMVVY